MTSVRLTDSQEMRLDRLCALTKRSKGFYIKEALERYLEDMGDEYLALDRLASPRKFLTTKEAIKRIESGK